MSTVSTSQPSSAPATPGPGELDPFRYGWRYVFVQQQDGTVDVDQVPLTLEDVMHPEQGDHIVESDPHGNDLVYLKTVFKARVVSDIHAVVLSDCAVDWNLPDTKPVAPDIAVFFEVKQRRGWSIIDVVAEQARTALIVEASSPDTRANDVVRKVDYYHRARVPVYVIVDARLESDETRRVELIAYRYTPRRYERIDPDARGRIWLDAIGVWLGITEDKITHFDRVACFDPVTNEEIGDYTALAQAFGEQTEARIRAEAIAAAEAQARAAAEARTAAAEARTADEAQARAAAEARIRELEAALKRSTPES